ncbi:TonB-dependent siderophore receptor [Xanthobacter sp. KR7-225]|uniref:TonB-dependent siderophore receptor n=1 Tax=Xanthobacter sp. KR7-225 TaxID=3156613 RepID=UPI0032B3C8D7
MPRVPRLVWAASASLIAMAQAASAQSPTPLPTLVVQPESTPAEGAAQGPPVEQTTAGPVQGYRALTAASATRTNTPIEQIPQSIQVVPRSVIDAQDDLSVAEAVRNVSATQGTNPVQTPAYNTAYIRGFPAEYWVDGLTTFYNGGDRDSLVNVERIEVLKGPNAILYGGGTGAPLGGVINLVSKLPTEKAFAELGFTFGSYRYLQPYFDVNTPLTQDGTVLFRFTGEYTSAGSFIDVLDTDRYSLNPTITFTNKSDTTLTIQGRFTSWEQQDYQGLPATGTVTGAFRLNPNMFIGPASLPDSYSRVASVTANFEHQINEIWSTSIQARISNTQFKELAQNFVGASLSGVDFTGNAPSFPPAYWNMINVSLYQEQQEATVVANALAEFTVGPTKNKLLFGADYSRVSDDGYMYGSLLDLFLRPPVNFLAPIYPPYVEPGPGLGNANVISDAQNVYATAGAYVQLQTTAWDRLHLLAGLRLANMRIESVSPAFQSSSTLDTTQALPRIGAVVDVLEGVSLYASYSQGLKANPFTIYLGPPKPEHSEQTEAGVKFDLGYGLTGSMAVFEINRTGVPVFTGLASEAIGEQRSRGFEADLLWQPNANWQVLANYAYVDAVLVNDIPGVAPAGSQLNIVPPNSGRLWVNYKFDPAVAKGWSVGAGLYAASGAYVDLANLYETSAYFTIDAKIAYETENFKAQLTAKNLTGEDYFVPYNYYGGRVAPGEARGVYGKVAWTFR